MNKGGKWMKNSLTVYVLSDSIGETGELLARAALSQFNSGKYHVRRFPFITEEEQIIEVFNEARKEPSVIIFTIVMRLKKFIEDLGRIQYSYCRLNDTSLRCHVFSITVST